MIRIGAANPPALSMPRKSASRMRPPNSAPPSRSRYPTRKFYVSREPRGRAGRGKTGNPEYTGFRSYMFTRPEEVTAIVQRPRLIALDLDGTLLPESKQLTARSRIALRAMEELGTTISLATGKFLHLAERYGEELGLRTPVVRSEERRVGEG